MRYELQTTLGVILEDGDTFEDVVSGLYSAMTEVLQDHEFANVSEYRVIAGDRDGEILVGIRFENGVKAQFVEDLATEILERTVNSFHRDASTIREESVRLQSVYA